MQSENGKLGRPIGFDKNLALNTAMLLFWERGFEGTSMADLTQAMGLNPSSIYAAFGDKKALFALAAKRYADVPAQYAAQALAEPTLARVVRALFANTVTFLSSTGHPASCMTLTGAMACSNEASPAKDLMTAMRKQNEAALEARLVQARKAGELSKELDVGDYARYISTILAGLAIQASNGASRTQLQRTAQMAVEHLGY